MGLIVAWVIFAILVGAIAASKGRSGIGFFLLSLFLSPLIGLLVALAVGRSTPLPVRVVNEPDPTAQIASLASLRSSGAISEDEYQAKKSELLARV